MTDLEVLQEIEKRISEALKGKNDHEVRRNFQSLHLWIQGKIRTWSI